MSMLKLYISSLFCGRSIFGLIFYFLASVLLPIIGSLTSHQLRWSIDGELAAIMISAFSIFSAMLFASQVAAFSVFNYKTIETHPKDSQDDIIMETNKLDFEERTADLRYAFRRINAGISVLTLSAITITALTILSTTAPSVELGTILTSLIVLLAAHFFVSFIITCFYVYNLFDSAYLGEDA